MRRAAGIAAIALLVGAAFATGLLLTRPGTPETTRTEAARARLIDEVRTELLTRYYKPVPPAALRKQTVDELLAALHDPYTEYLNAAEYDQLTKSTSTSYSGVGLTVAPSGRGLLVRAALDGPAREAGIAPGDVIVAIDGRAVRRLPFARSLALIQGRTGTEVRLKVLRSDGRAEHVTIVRQEVTLPTIRTRIAGQGDARIGFLRLRSFPANAEERIARETERLLDRGADALVIDLRDNPGGLLAQAVRVVSLFQADGIVCTTVGAHQPRRVFEVNGSAPFAEVPLAVLVDRGSASAAEIVAGALRDNDRATVVGRRTYGKALVQTIRELSNGEALKLTTAVFATPAGDTLEDGIVPDVRAVDLERTRRDEVLRAAERVLVEQLAA